MKNKEWRSEQLNEYRKRMYEKCIVEGYIKYCKVGPNASGDYLRGEKRYRKRVERYRKKYLNK